MIIYALIRTHGRSHNSTKCQSRLAQFDHTPAKYINVDMADNGRGLMIRVQLHDAGKLVSEGKRYIKR